MASSPCQEAMFHEESIHVATITSAQYLISPFSSIYSITNGENVLLVDVHSEPSLEDGFYSHEIIDSKYG